MNTTRGLWNQTIGQLGATLRALEVNGVTEEHLHLIRSNPEYAKNIAKFICLTAAELNSPNHEWARQAMNDNFFGIEEAVTYLGVQPTEDQISALSRIPFSLEELHERKNTHFLIAVFPMSVLDIRDTVSPGFFAEQDWYNKEPSVNEKGEVGWKLIRKKIIERSLHSTWEKQKKIISFNEEIPNFRNLLYFIVAYELLFDRKIIGREKEEWIRSSDLVTEGSFIGRPISVGRRENDLIIATDCNVEFPDFGIISSLIPNKIS